MQRPASVEALEFVEFGWRELDGATVVTLFHLRQAHVPES